MAFSFSVASWISCSRSVVFLKDGPVGAGAAPVRNASGFGAAAGSHTATSPEAPCRAFVTRSTSPRVRRKEMAATTAYAMYATRITSGSFKSRNFGSTNIKPSGNIERSMFGRGASGAGRADGADMMVDGYVGARGAAGTQRGWEADVGLF